MAKHAFEEDRVGAGVAAPEAPLDGGHDEKRQADAAQQEEHQPEVLRVEHPAEQVESSVDDIHEDGGVPPDFHERQRNVNRNEHREEDVAKPREATFDVGGVNVVTATVRAKRASVFLDDWQLRRHGYSLGSAAPSATSPSGFHSSA